MPAISSPGASRSLLLPIAVAAALAALVSFAAIDETDLGWHIALGRRMLATGSIVRTNALTWTTPDEPWYATSWLYDVVVAWLDAHAGLRGLQALTFALTTATAAVLAVTCRRLEPAFGAWLGPVLVLLASPRITARPHVATWLVLAAVLALCVEPSGDVPRRRRWLSVLAIAVGSNLHSGVFFAAGLVSLFALEAAWRTRRWAGEAAVAFAAVLALCANPGGLYNIGYLFENLHATKVVDVAEMAPTTLAGFPPFFVGLAFALAAGWARRRDRPSWLAATVAFGALGLFATRQAVDFLVITLPFLADGIAGLRAAGRGRAAALALVLAVASGVQAAGVSFLRFSHAAVWDEEVLPVRALAYVRASGLTGRPWNSYDDGGYFEYVLPGVPAFQDGRLQAFPPSFFAESTRAAASPEAFSAYLRARQVDWALVGRSREAGVSNAGQHLAGPAWARVYWDPVHELLLRRDEPRFAALIARDEYRWFVPEGSLYDRVVVLVGSLDAPSRQAYEAEVERYLRSSPGDRFGLLAACALRSRRGAADRPRLCDEALQAASSAGEAQLVAQARALAPAAP